MRVERGRPRFAGAMRAWQLLVPGTYAALLCLIMILGIGGTAGSMPMFSRKYNLPCAHCHTMPPRLTRFGYAFYRAGFRLPEGFRVPGNEVIPYTFANSVSAFSESRLQNINPGGPSGFDFGGVELGLATSIDKKLALRAQYVFSSTSETGSGFDEAWVQYNSAPSGRSWSIRAGQMPILSGFQLLGSRNITLTDPQLIGPNGPLMGDGQGNFAIAGWSAEWKWATRTAGFTGAFHGSTESMKPGMAAWRLPDTAPTTSWRKRNTCSDGKAALSAPSTTGARRRSIP